MDTGKQFIVVCHFQRRLAPRVGHTNVHSDDDNHTTVRFNEAVRRLCVKSGGNHSVFRTLCA